MIIRSEKIVNAITKAPDLISTPEQRLITGVTALVLQPTIDLNNKKLDEETRTLTACRSIGKIIAGTISGVTVRAGYIFIINKILDNKKDFIQDILKKSSNSKNSIIDSHQKKMYSNLLGSVAALGVMLMTNSLWDAPVTQKLTNFFYKKVSDKKETIQK